MATIGHTLVGLSLSETCPEKARDGKMPYVWAGLVVLSAHVVDLVEWLALLVAPIHWDKHFLTHSPWMALGVAAVICGCAAAVTGTRRLWPYLVLTIAVMSHLLLDAPVIRSLIGGAYGFPVDEHLPEYPAAILAELWGYGLIFVLTTLIVSWRQRRMSRKARNLALAFGVFCCLSAATRNPNIWGPTYLVAMVHCGLMWMKQFDWRYAKSAIPLIPLLILPSTDLYADSLTKRAIVMREEGHIEEAIELNLSVLRIPTRKSCVTNYLELGRCYLRQNRLDVAENAFINVRKESQAYGNYLGDFWLAKFYTDDRTVDTPYFRPEEAESLLDRVIRKSPVEQHQQWASKFKAQLIRKGILHQAQPELSPARISVP